MFSHRGQRVCRSKPKRVSCALEFRLVGRMGSGLTHGSLWFGKVCDNPIEDHERMLQNGTKAGKQLKPSIVGADCKNAALMRGAHAMVTMMRLVVLVCVRDRCALAEKPDITYVAYRARQAFSVWDAFPNFGCAEWYANHAFREMHETRRERERANHK